MNKARLHELFEYGEDAYGAFLLRLIRAGKRGKVGDKVRGTQAAIYTTVRIDGKSYRFHRIVWLMHNPTIPEFLDHKDTNPSNNCYSNLRQCTSAENARNRRVYREALGVTKKPGGWQAAINHKRVYHYIGLFPTKPEAVQARADFKQHLLKQERDF